MTKEEKKVKKTKEKRYTLKELVEKSNVRLPIIMFKLVLNGYYEQYIDELNTNEEIKPTLTVKEFDKILEDR